MNCSFLLLGIPILLLNIPFKIILSILLLLFSSFLYHNYYENQDNSFYSKYILLFDQLNIIHTSCMIGLQSYHYSLQYIFIYLIEKFMYNGSWTCRFVYFLCFLNMINIPIFCFFVINTLIYTYCQNRDFSIIERYLWHSSQSIYILLALLKIYSFRKVIFTYMNYLPLSKYKNKIRFDLLSLNEILSFIKKK